MTTLIVNFSDGQSFDCTFESDEFGCEFDGVVIGDYEGPMTVTPSQQTQYLPTNKTTVVGNITIEPIPSNDGLITWNGSVLTVS